MFAVGFTMTMCGKKSTPMTPEQRPDLFPVGPRQVKLIDGCRRMKLEETFPVRRRQRLNAGLDFEQKHQPMRRSLVTLFTDQSGEVQVGGLKGPLHFFGGLAASAGVGGFALVEVQFATAGTPATAVWLPIALQQEHFIPVIEWIEQGRNVIR